MAAAVEPDSNVCFAELIVRLDSLLTLRSDVAEAEAGNDRDEDAANANEADIKMKLRELHLRLKNGGALQDRTTPGNNNDDDDDDDEDDEAVEDSQGPSSANEGAVGSVDCVGCSSAEDENDICPSPIQPKMKARQSKTLQRQMKLMNHENITALLRLCLLVFTNTNFCQETIALAAQLVAEICKSDEGRRMALRYKNPGGISIVRGIGSVLSRDCSLETCVQICRIVGNLCYECVEGRTQIGAEAADIFVPLVDVLRDKDRAAQEDPGQRLPVIFPGALLNFCNDTPASVDIMTRFECIEVVVQNIMMTKTNDAVFNASVLFLNSLADEEVGIQRLARCDPIPQAICHILEHTTSPEVFSTTFEMLKACSESPALSLHLAKGGLLTHMITHMNDRMQSEVFQQLRFTECDILVTIFSHDEAMQHVYKTEGKAFIDKFLDWLENGEDSGPLRVTAALCIGNFCCNGKNCQDLIARVGPALISTLAAHTTALVGNVKLQHALLAALRNLAVSPEGRPVLLKLGVLQPCIETLVTTQLTPVTQPVVAKLMAVLRLLVDTGTVADEIGVQRPDVLAQIIGFSSNDMGGPAIAAESGRLLAGILKHSRSKKALSNVVNMGGLPAVTVMLHSSHSRMLNESLIGLTLLCTGLTGRLDGKVDPADEELVHRHLHTDLIIQGLKRCFQPDNGFPVEIAANAATLAVCLLAVRKREFKQMLHDMNFARECGLTPEKVPELPKECVKLYDMLNE